MKSKIVVGGICLLFLICGYYANLRPVPVAKQKTISLKQSLGPVDGWELVSNNPLLDVIVDELKLDDYVNQTYTNGQDFITLYIGYYYSSQKVGAAHDPTVCFPGQGWLIKNPSKGTLAESKNIKDPFEYASMVAELGESIELLVYWFQAYDTPASSTFLQKLFKEKKKLGGKREDNAFVRITTPCKSKDFAACKQIALNFIDNFYPPFLKFVTEDPN